MTRKAYVIPLLAVLFIFYFALPNLGFAGDGHNHSGDSHQGHSDSDGHSHHDHEKKKSKKGHKGKSHDHSEEEEEAHDHDHDKGDGHKHGKGDGYKHNKSSSNEKGEAHGESHGHAHSEDEAHEDEDGLAHSANEKHGDEDDHAHSEEGGHDDHGEEEAHAHTESGDHDDHGGGSGIGPGKAITEVKNEGSKFKLSPESVKYLNITSEPIRISGNGLVTVSKNSLVRYQNTKGIYVKVGDWYEIKKVQVVEDNGQEVIIRASNLNSNSKIATSGLGFLRAAHLQASGQGGKGHAH